MTNYLILRKPKCYSLKHTFKLPPVIFCGKLYLGGIARLLPSPWDLESKQSTYMFQKSWAMLKKTLYCLGHWDFCKNNMKFQKASTLCSILSSLRSISVKEQASQHWGSTSSVIPGLMLASTPFWNSKSAVIRLISTMHPSGRQNHLFVAKSIFCAEKNNKGMYF